MKRFFLLSMILLAVLSPLACSKTYTLAPSSVPTVTPTPTATTPYVITFAGSVTAPGSANGTGTAASFNHPSGVAVDSSGNVYVGDYTNGLIREISPSEVVMTLAGGGVCCGMNGTGTSASFYLPLGVAVDTSGNLYVADSADNLIREITSGAVVSTLAGSGSIGTANGAANSASFDFPTGVAVDSSGNVYVADYYNNVIREISAGVVSTLAGQMPPAPQGFTNGTGTAASFASPGAVAVDKAGNIYVADTSNNMIRKIASGAVVTTLAGQFTPGFVNATGTAASFNAPAGIAVDAAGNVYVGDYGNNAVREITPGRSGNDSGGHGGSGGCQWSGQQRFVQRARGCGGGRFRKCLCRG